MENTQTSTSTTLDKYKTKKPLSIVFSERYGGQSQSNRFQELQGQHHHQPYRRSSQSFIQQTLGLCNVQGMGAGRKSWDILCPEEALGLEEKRGGNRLQAITRQARTQAWCF